MAPIGTLDQNVGLYLCDDRERSVFVEHDDGIDEAQRQENLDPLLGSIDRSSRGPCLRAPIDPS